MPRANASPKNRLSVVLLAAAIACCFCLPPAFGQAQTSPRNTVEWWNEPAGLARAVGAMGNSPVSVALRASATRPGAIRSRSALTRRRSKRRSGATLADPVHSAAVTLGPGSEPALLDSQVNTILRSPAGAETLAAGYVGYNSGYGTAHSPLAMRGSAGLRSAHIIHPDSPTNDIFSNGAGAGLSTRSPSDSGASNAGNGGTILFPTRPNLLNSVSGSTMSTTRINGGGSTNLAVGSIPFVRVVSSAWNGGTGNWSAPTDWTPNGIPRNGFGIFYNVTIDSGGTDLVSLDINAAIASLVLGGTTGSSTLQNVSGKTLEVTGATTIYQTGSLSFANASTLKFDGGLTLNSGSSLSVEGGSGLTVNGNLTNSGSLYTGFADVTGYGGGNTLTVNGDFTNNGSLTVYGSYGAGTADTLNVSGTLTNNAGATLKLVDNSGDVLNVATLSNSGSVYVAYGTTLNLTSQPKGITDVPLGSALTVDGTLTAGSANGLAKLTSVEGGLTLGNGQTTADTPSGGPLTVASAGSLNLAGTALSVNGGLTVASAGSVNLYPGTTLSVNGGLIVGGQFYLSPCFECSGATATITGNGTLTSGGVIFVNGGSTLNLKQGLTLNSGSSASLEMNSTLTVDGNLTNSGAILTGHVGTGLAQGGNTLTVNGAFINDGSLEMDGGIAGGDTLSVAGTLTNNAGATLKLFGNSFASIATLSNSGSVYIDSGTVLNLTNGITDVPAGSTLTVNGTLSANGLGKLASVEGTLSLATGQTYADTPSGGTLTVASGGSLTLNGTNLSVTGTLNDSGSVTVGGGATLNLTQSMTDLPAGGSMTVYGTTNGLAKLTSVGGSLTLGNGQTSSDTPSGGTLTVPSGGSLNLVGATLSVTGGLNDSGSVSVLNGSTLNLTQSMTLNSSTSTNVDGGGTLTVTGNLMNSGTLNTGANYGGGNTLTVSAGFTNNASLTMYGSTYGGAGDTLNVSGTLTNNAGATLNLVDNSGDVANVATLRNSGSVNILNGTLLNLTASGIDTNSGTISVGSSVGPGTLKISASAVTLSGTGKVIMSNLASNVITGAASTDILTSANTIEGSGNIGNGAMGFVNTGTVLANQSTPLIIDPSSRGFNNKGTLNVTGRFDTLQIIGPAGSFLNLNSTTGTLTGGTYLVSGTLNLATSGQSNDIKTNVASITLTGILSQITDQSGSNALAPFVTNAAAGQFGLAGGQNFTTTGNFTNNGTLAVGSGSKFEVNGALTNLSGTTLTGGTYNVAGALQFGARGTSLKTNAASIALTGAGSQIIDLSFGNILANFATNAASGIFALAGGRNFTTAGNFTNNGTLTIGSGGKFDVNGSLTNFSGTTLTGGTYSVAGTLQFNGANIVANAANITLTGVSSQIVNQTSGNGLASFATNAATGSFTVAGGRTLTTAGAFVNAGSLSTTGAGSEFTTGGSAKFTNNGTLMTAGGDHEIATGATGGFTNNGALTVAAGSEFTTGGSLTNFSGTTLTGGTYALTGTLQFTGANIVTNAANITLTGTGSQIINQTNGNGLANFATNAAAGSFTLAGTRSLTTAGSFSNAGTLLVSKGSTLTVGANGKYTQTGGKTMVDGTLKTSSPGAITIWGGSVFGNGGTFSGNLTSSGNINIGDAVLQAGMLSIAGTYTQDAAGSLVADIGGLTKDTQYDQLDISSAASLNGALRTYEINGFLPKVGETFDILNFSSETGKFSSCNGHAGGTTCSINGGEHFLVEYNANNVTLDVVGGAAGQSSNPTPEPCTVILFGTALAMAAYLGLREVVSGRYC
jgi:fibronectin-binding autotransporter adhesin